MTIRMVDTITQYHHIQEEVDKAVLDVIRSSVYINGPIVDRFKQNLAAFLDVPYVIPCANGTDALQIALMALGLEPGDEVITPTFTYVATVEVIALLRLKPVFVDTDPDTFNIDVKQIERHITPKTRAIIPVHLFGQPADMRPILEIAEKYNLSIVEDNAQAIGSDYYFDDGRVQKTGTIGQIGCTSFYPSKNLGAYGDGGAICTRNENLAEELWMICNHGSKRRYYHETIGVNSRLDAVQAAILDVKLKHLHRYNASRIWAADRYDDFLGDISEIQLPVRSNFGSHVFHQYTLRIKAGVEKRDRLKTYLEKAGIPSMIYYPVPLHLQDAYRGYGYEEGQFPIAEQLTGEVLSLPMHSELTEEQLQFIAQHIKSGLQSV